MRWTLSHHGVYKLFYLGPFTALHVREAVIYYLVGRTTSIDFLALYFMLGLPYYTAQC